MVYPKATDGLSVGVPIPLRTFVALGAGGNVGTFRITTPSADEANWLAKLNADRAAHGLASQTFDEINEEAARLHVNDMNNLAYGACHYDSSDHGPPTRYLTLGGIEFNSESIAIYGGPSVGASGPVTPATYWPGVEDAFWREGPGGPHYDQVAGNYQWAGTAVASVPQASGGPNGIFISADLESTQENTGASVAGVYPVGLGDCPPGITANGS